MIGDSSSEQTPPADRLLWVDVLRVMASFLIVLAHVHGWGESPKYPVSFFYTLSRLGVPLFFMISGYLLLSKQEPLGVFFRKRAEKILIPWLGWSVIYDIQARGWPGLNWASLGELLLRILRGPRAPHLWFLYALIGLYLFTPLLRPFIAQAKRQEMLYFLALWLWSTSLSYLLTAFTRLRFGLEIYFSLGHVGYFVAVPFLDTWKVDRRRLSLLALLFLLAFAFTFAVFYLDWFPKADEAALRSYLSLNVVGMTFAVFPLLRALAQKVPPAFAPLISTLSRASFGVYLVHALILDGLAWFWQRLGGVPSAGNTLFLIPLIAILAYLLSLAVTLLLQRLPLAKALVP